MCLCVFVSVCVSVDPSVTGFREKTVPKPILEKGVEEDIKLEVDIENVGAPGSGNDIAAVTGSDANFRFSLFLSDVDMQFTSSNLNFLISTFNVKESLQQSLNVGASNKKTFTIAAKVTMPSAHCASITRLCLVLSEGRGASYKDASTRNNIMCIVISSIKQCDAG